MTTAKQPATPYDAEYERLDKQLSRIMKDGGDDFVTRHDRAEAIGKRKGWLARSADLAPLHWQLVEACETAITALKNEWLYQTGQFSRKANPPSNYPPQGTAHGDLPTAIGKLRTALDAAGKAGL